MWMVIFSLIMTTSAKSNCDFQYDKFGENLSYVCGEKRQKVTFKEKKMYLGGNIAPKKVHSQYHLWTKEKRQIKSDFKNQKDQFLCH